MKIYHVLPLVAALIAVYSAHRAGVAMTLLHCFMLTWLKDAKNGDTDG